MKNTSFAVKASIIVSMLISSQAFAQNLPDEINHTHYLRIYQNLEQVLNQKIAEYDKLSAEKAEVEKTIAQMEKDQVEIPARNQELRTIIQNNQREISRIDSEIQGLESILGQIIEDLRRIDNMIAQLQRDLSQEEGKARQIQIRRNQIAQDVAQINARLDREVREENQSVQTLNRLTGEMNASQERENEVQRERAQLIRDVERFRTEIVQVRNNINQNNHELSAKKPQLEQARAKLPGVKAELSSEEAKLSQIDAQLSPKQRELNKLKAELANASPEINRLQIENRSLEQKITANEAKIKKLDPQRLIERRDSLENQISGVKNQIKANTDQKIALQEKIKPTIGQINDLTVKMREALRRRDMPEVARLRNEIEALENTIAGDKREIERLQKESDRLTISIAARQGEINQLNASITSNQNQVTSLQNEIDSSKSKIVANDKKIAELSQANAGLAQKIAQLEAEIKTLDNQRDPLARKVTQLKREETQLTQEISNLGNQIQRLEAEVKKLNERIADMQKTIDEYPQTMRRLDAHIRQLNEKVRELRSQVDREQRLLARIRQDRMAVQAERDRAQNVLDQVNQDLTNTERLIGAIRNKLNEKQNERDTLTRHNQDSIRKLDNLKIVKANTEKEISAASEEIRINDQDLATIARELPLLHQDLNVLNPKVAAAMNAKNNAETNANNANSNYQSRLSLYQKYLTEAQSLGVSRAAIGSQDGAKAGAIEARTRANKLASESASNEGKWEAIRRGYVRGEIAGFKNGFDIGLSSTPDAQRGDEEGRIAGARRAKDHANMVVKPEKYLEELERRLKEDQTSTSKPMIAMMIQDEIKNIKSMSRELESTIPDLSQKEIEDASRIVSSLDALIAQSDIEIAEILELRKKLSVAANVYAAPGTGENENNANCSGVYKGVKDFVEACKGSYVVRYQNLYKEAHENSFSKDYASIFKSQIENVFESELNRLYNGFFTEASNVGRQVGISSGKKEIYQQSFNRAESNAYGGNLPNEIARVESEAVTLVQEHLNQNSALTLKGSAKVITSNIFGISPGADLDLKMLIKNIGSVASNGNSIVRITQVSGNLSLERREAPLTSVAARSHADLSVMKIRVDDAAIPGSEVVIAGEIVHPGNHYRSNRVESFRIETSLGINPSVNSSLDMDKSPKVSGLFGIIKKHDIDVKISPKYAGVQNGYEVTLEEIGSDYVSIVSRPGVTEVLNRNQEKNVRFVYKLTKAARGKTVNLKLTVKNEGKIISEETIQIKPE